MYKGDVRRIVRMSSCRMIPGAQSGSSPLVYTRPQLPWEAPAPMQS